MQIIHSYLGWDPAKESPPAHKIDPKSPKHDPHITNITGLDLGSVHQNEADDESESAIQALTASFNKSLKDNTERWVPIWVVFILSLTKMVTSFHSYGESPFRGGFMTNWYCSTILVVILQQ